MPLQKIVNVIKTTAFKSELLLFIPAIMYGADQIISFFSLNNTVDYLFLVLPQKIAYGKVACTALDIILLFHSLFEK